MQENQVARVKERLPSDSRRQNARTPLAALSEPGQEFDVGYANRALVLLSVMAALIFYVDTMLTPALPKIVAEYGVSIDHASLIISLYTVFGVAVIPIFGKLGDIYGKKRVILYILVFYLIAATATSLAPNFNLILVSRFVQGTGLGVFALAFSLAREQFPRNLVPRAQGIISAVQVAGGALGLVGGAVVTNEFGWQDNYWIAIPVMAVLTALIFLVVRESTERKPGVELDYVGAAWLAASLTSIVLALSEGPTWGWSSPLILGLLVIGPVLLVSLPFYERRIDEPVLNLRLLRQRNMMAADLIIICYGLSLGIAFQTVVYALELPPPSGFGIGITSVGAYLLPLVFVVLPVALIVGRAIPKYGVKPFLYLGSVIAAAAFFLLSTYTSPGQIEAYLIVYAFGSGMLTVSIQSLLVLSIAKSEMALGTSLNTAFRYVGQTLGAPVAGAFLSTYVTGVTMLPTRVAFQCCFYVAVAAFIIVGLVSTFAREVIGKDSPASTTMT